MNKAFAGLRVLDFTTTIAGPHCTRLLADLGADVVKIEAPEGDVMRSRPPLRNGASSYFGQLNAGKRSVVLDLKDARAVEAARRLAGGVDILVENYRPGVMRRLGLDYAALGKANPRLVYCSISGYGQTGPSADLPAYAPVIHATSGFDLAQPRLPEGPAAPGLLRRLRRRRGGGHLRLRRHRLGAAPAPRDRQGPAPRRVDAREHAVADARPSCRRRSSRCRLRPAGRSSGPWRPPTAISTWPW